MKSSDLPRMSQMTVEYIAEAGAVEPAMLQINFGTSIMPCERRGGTQDHFFQNLSMHTGNV